MPIWITGTGSITCVGKGVETLWRSAMAGDSGLRSGLGYVPDSGLPESDPPAKSRSVQFGLVAAHEAMQMAGWDHLQDDDGLILATTTGQIPLWNGVLRDYLNGLATRQEFFNAFEHQPLGDLLAHLSQALDFNGRRTLVTSACSASTQALGLAAMWLKQGRVKRCLVGGIEVLCDLTISGFRSLQLLSESTARPFDANRSGINLSEGAGFLCLEAEASPRSVARLSGYGMTSDGYHMTAPHPEGRGSMEAMRLALQVAELNPADIQWIHAHGTGSPHNDAAEGMAIQRLFTERPWVTSSKWTHGHTLGAAGAIESILCIEALRQQMVIPTFGLSTPDPALSLNHPRDPIRFEAHRPLKHILKNTLGFGGTNAALVLSQVEPFT